MSAAGSNMLQYNGRYHHASQAVGKSITTDEASFFKEYDYPF